MRKIVFILFFIEPGFLFGQSIGIGTNNPDSSAALDIQSNSKGLLIPRLTSGQRKAIVNPTSGLMVFDTDKRTIFMFENGMWMHLKFDKSDYVPPAPLNVSDAQIDDQLGYAVGISGEYAMATAPFRDAGSNFDQGAVYIFHRTNGVWSQDTILTASDGGANDQMGKSAVMAGDYIAVGCPNSDLGGTNRGAVYIFQRIGNNWIQQARIGAVDGAANDLFGTSVSFDGDNLLIGAPEDDIGSNTNQGSAYLFTRSGNSWNFIKKFTATDGAAEDKYGSSVSISGVFAIIGSPQDDHNGTNDGSAYIYWGVSVPAWSQVQKIFLPPTNTIALGSRVFINGTRAYVNYSINLVGTYQRVYDRGNFGIWFDNGNPTPAYRININGESMITGNESYSGSFTNQGRATAARSVNGTWSNARTYIEEFPSDNAFFGCDVAVDGYHGIIGVRGKSSNRGQVQFVQFE